MPVSFVSLSRALLSFTVLLFLSFTLNAQSSQTVNPLESDPRAATAGGSIFRAQCATCHGADAKGIEDIDAPDLTLLWSLGNATDAGVFQTIREGVPGSIMPPHALPDAEIWMLVSYLKRAGAGNASDTFGGDPQRGATLFAANCARCHRAGGNGGSLGPDLSLVTAFRSKDSLNNSIRNPSSVLVRRYSPVSIVTADNERVRGTIKSEDAFSVQIMDSDQNLRAFMKANLNEFSYETSSLMPAFAPAQLSEANVEDILSYLENLRRQARN
jgi:putative heme-binding domain-containing protein